MDARFLEGLEEGQNGKLQTLVWDKCTSSRLLREQMVVVVRMYVPRIVKRLEMTQNLVETKACHFMTHPRRKSEQPKAISQAIGEAKAISQAIGETSRHSTIILTISHTRVKTGLLK